MLSASRRAVAPSQRVCFLLFLNSPCGNHFGRAAPVPEPMSRRFRNQPPGQAGPGKARWPERAARARPAIRSGQPEVGTFRRNVRVSGHVGRLGEASLPWLVCLLLAAVTLAVFWPATGFDFVNYDDPLYVTDNPHVQAGLTWEGLAWAFGRVHGEETYWHPLTWVSHMVDCQLYGLKPGSPSDQCAAPRGQCGPGVSGVPENDRGVLAVRGAGGAVCAAPAAGGLGGVGDGAQEPAERLLLAADHLGLRALRGEVRSAESESESRSPSRTRIRPSDHASRSSSRPHVFYLLSLLFFALGLMCKPVLVTLPFVLLLLDYWPLRGASQTLNASTLNRSTPFGCLALGRRSRSLSWPPPRARSPSWPTALWACWILSPGCPGTRALRMPWSPMFATWERPFGRPAWRSFTPIPPPGRCGKWSRADCCCWSSPAWFWARPEAVPGCSWAGFGFWGCWCRSSG